MTPCLARKLPVVPWSASCIFTSLREDLVFHSKLQTFWIWMFGESVSQSTEPKPYASPLFLAVSVCPVTGPPEHVFIIQVPLRKSAALIGLHGQSFALGIQCFSSPWHGYVVFLRGCKPASRVYLSGERVPPPPEVNQRDL